MTGQAGSQGGVLRKRLAASNGARHSYKVTRDCEERRKVTAELPAEGCKPAGTREDSPSSNQKEDDWTDEQVDQGCHKHQLGEAGRGD